MFSFLLILSECAQESNWVPKELDLAITYNKVIIPFQIDDEMLTKPFNFRLTNVQRIEAFHNLEEAYDQLLGRIVIQETHIHNVCRKSSCELLDESSQDLSEASYNTEEFRRIDFATDHFVDKGMIGDNITWKLESNGDLRINGFGELNCSTLYGQTLDSVVVDSHLEKIKKDVKRLFVGDGIEIIGEFSFYQFFNLSEVYVSYTVKKIAAGAFKDCHSLTVLEKHVNKSITIFQKTFENCTSLEKVTLENVNLVGMYAFKGCAALSHVDLSFRQDGLIKKGQTLQSHALAFSGVKELHLAFPSLIKIAAIFYGIGDNCFEGCDKLTDVFFEDEIPYISDNAFPQQSRVCIYVSENARGI